MYTIPVNLRSCQWPQDDLKMTSTHFYPRKHCFFKTKIVLQFGGIFWKFEKSEKIRKNHCKNEFVLVIFENSFLCKYFTRKLYVTPTLQMYQMHYVPYQVFMLRICSSTMLVITSKLHLVQFYNNVTRKIPMVNKVILKFPTTQTTAYVSNMYITLYLHTSAIYSELPRKGFFRSPL